VIGPRPWSLLAAALVAAHAAAAQAQPAATPLAVTRRPLVIEPGRCEATLVIESNESARRRFEPISLAPDLHCGVHPRLALGVTHSARSLSLIDSGDGLCLRGADGGCSHVYDGTAIDALTKIRDQPDQDVAVAARARLVAASYSPFKPSLRVGALVRLRRGSVAVVLDPHLAFGLASRDRGNRDQLNIPLVGQVQIGPRVVVSLRSGARGELVTFADAFAVPVGAGVEFSPSPVWDIGFEAGFPRLLGPQNTFRERHLGLHVTYLLRAAPPPSHERLSSDDSR